MKYWKVYTLTDPEARVIRYVGCSGSLTSRIDQHCAGTTPSTKAWILSLRQKGLRPVVERASIHTSRQDALEAESTLIQKLRAVGVPLLNRDEGIYVAGNSSTEQAFEKSPIQFMDPLKKGRSIFTASRLAIFEGGYVCPVLLWLAWKKFGVYPIEWKQRGLLVFWRDGDSTNETLENVDFATRIKRPRKKAA